MRLNKNISWAITNTSCMPSPLIMHAGLQITDRNYRNDWKSSQKKKSFFYVYWDQISWKYNLNKHTIHLEPLELQRNSVYVVIRRFYNHLHDWDQNRSTELELCQNHWKSSKSCSKHTIKEGNYFISNQYSKRKFFSASTL